VPTLIYRQPGSNELTTAREIRKTMAQLAKDFPPGVAYENQYDATVFITSPCTKSPGLTPPIIPAPPTTDGPRRNDADIHVSF
jgi:hypothetical protein